MSCPKLNTDCTAWYSYVSSQGLVQELVLQIHKHVYINGTDGPFWIVSVEKVPAAIKVRYGSNQ